jgi:CRP/FNR family cyclic AMP-dependent transcriptional regulator
VSYPPFLDALTIADRDALLALLRRRTLATGTVLLREGEPGNDVLVVLDGMVKLVATPPQGREVVLGMRGAGDLLGELSALDGEPRSASVVALGDVEVGILSATALREFLADRPRAALVIMRLLVERLREADRGRVELSIHDTLGRVAARLVVLCDRLGEPCDDGQRIAMPLTQAELASWVGASRQAVAGALNVMRKLGWVTTSQRAITVQDVETLRVYAHG